MTRTLQEAFDISASHLIAQGIRSVIPAAIESDVNQCAYRSPDGLRCAIGVPIPDELYRAAMEGRTSREDMIGNALVAAGWSLTDEFGHLIGRLQTVHDTYSPVEWDEQLRGIAVMFALDATVLDTVEAPR